MGAKSGNARGPGFILCALANALCLSAAAAAVLEVDGRANLFGAGHSAVSDPGFGGAGILPPSINFTAGSNLVLTFTSVTGTVSCCDGDSSFNDADGGPFATGDTDINSFNGISGMVHPTRTMYLAGAFLSDDEPVDPAPTRLSFSEPEDFATLSPLLNQSFFIGDGLTDTGGVTQRFLVPVGATRLFLGFVDAINFGDPVSDPGFYDDNQGSLTAEFNLAAVPVPAAAWLFGSAIAALSIKLRRRN